MGNKNMQRVKCQRVYFYTKYIAQSLKKKKTCTCQVHTFNPANLASKIWNWHDLYLSSRNTKLKSICSTTFLSHFYFKKIRLREKKVIKIFSYSMLLSISTFGLVTIK